MSSSCSRGRSRSPVQQGGVGKDGGGGSGDQQQPVKTDEKGVGKDGGGGSGDQQQPVKTDENGVELRPMQVFVKTDEARVGQLFDVWPWHTTLQAKEKIYLATNDPLFSLMGEFSDVCNLFDLYHADVANDYIAQGATVPVALRLDNDVTLRDQGIHHGDTLCLFWCAEEVD